MRFGGHFAKAGAKVLLFFELTKLFEDFLQKKRVFCKKSAFLCVFCL